MGSRFPCAALFALALVGCDDSAVPSAPGGTGGVIIIPPPPGGTGGSGATGASGGAPGAGGTAAAGGTGTGGMSGAGGTGGIVDAGACTNAADFPILMNLVDPAIVRSTSADCAASTCVPNSGNQVRFIECVAACVSLEYGLTEECAACYGDLEWCSSLLCANECAGVDGSDAAAACSCPATFACQQADYPGCLTELFDCAGTIPRECLED